jgi:hypothetical protein
MNATPNPHSHDPAIPSEEVSAELDEVRQRRAELHESLNSLELALAAPSPDREVQWGEQVYIAMLELSEDFSAHIAVTEGPDGLHQAIVAADVRLANGVVALTAEHATIDAAISALVSECRGPVAPEAVAVIREDGTSLLGKIIRHRQRGADLIYEAYAFDVGGDG